MTAQLQTREIKKVTLESKPSRWLFIKERFAWPRASGHDVHTYGMMKALTELGHEVHVLTVDPAPDEALAAIPSERRHCLKSIECTQQLKERYPLLFTQMQAKFASYWGTSTESIHKVAAVADQCQADVVVVSGLNVLPYHGAIRDRVKVWYAADEWVWHHLSMLRLTRPSTWSELKPAILKGIYQRAYRPMLDRVWVVTEQDAWAFRRFNGITQTDIIPNGVDTEWYQPGSETQQAKSCVFWGRLDFGPNIQALDWFVANVWPKIRARVPEATLRIYGFQPTADIRALSGRGGIELTADAPDIRPLVRSNQVVVLPFVSGGGIKNKLLEAAALGMPIVASQRAFLGLNGQPPIMCPATPEKWADTITDLWSDASKRQRMGESARIWVSEQHTWAAAARGVLLGVSPLLRGERT